MLLKPKPDDYTGRHPEPNDVFLLIEVSDTTLEYDPALKLPAYARAGVPEVWSINVTEKKVEIYREPNFIELPGIATLCLFQSAGLRFLALDDAADQTIQTLRCARSARSRRRAFFSNPPASR